VSIDGSYKIVPPCLADRIAILYRNVAFRAFCLTRFGELRIDKRLFAA
jgi:hypothetical protein